MYIYIYIHLLPTGPRVFATPNLCFLFLVIFCTVYDDHRPIKSSGCLLLTRGSSGASWIPQVKTFMFGNFFHFGAGVRNDLTILC